MGDVTKRDAGEESEREVEFGPISLNPNQLLCPHAFHFLFGRAQRQASAG